MTVNSNSLYSNSLYSNSLYSNSLYYRPKSTSHQTDFDDSFEVASVNEYCLNENGFQQLSDLSIEIERKFQTEDTEDFSYLQIAQNEYTRHKQIARALEAQLEQNVFQAECEESKKKFEILEVEHHELCNYSGIKPAKFGKIYPFSLEVCQDHTIIAPATIPLFTQSLRECIAVIVRGDGVNGPFHALLHFSDFFDPEKVLTKIFNKLEEKGCDPDSFKVCLIGGKLPSINRTEYPNGTFIEQYCSGSLSQELEFLSLHRKFNIVGVQFNLAEGDNESLAVQISEDEIVWTKNDFDFEKESIEEKDRSLVEHYTNPEEVSSSEEESEESYIQYFEFPENSASLKRKIGDEEMMDHFPKKMKSSDNEIVEVTPLIQKLADVCTIGDGSIDIDSTGKILREEDDL